jgi:hypothetical protein
MEAADADKNVKELSDKYLVEVKGDMVCYLPA